MEQLNSSLLLSTTNFGLMVLYCLFALMPFAILGYLFSKHLKKKPSFLIEFERMKDLENAWTLLLVITAPLVFIYNVFVWAGWSFVIIANFTATIMKKIYDYIIYKYIITPLKNAIKWIVNALIWLFLNALWIPITIIFKLLYHYLILWPWDIYLSSFNSLKNTFNKQKLKTGFLGSFYTFIIVGCALYLTILTETPIILILGIIIALLPTLKAHGTITSMIHSPEKDNEDHLFHGKKVLRTCLNYILISLGAVVLIHLLFFLSFIPNFGLIILGISINANVFFSALVIFSLAILLFAKSLIPNHLLYNEETTSVKKSFSNYLDGVRKKGPQLLFSLIPGLIWSLLVISIPIIFISGSIFLTDNAKNRVLEDRQYEIKQKIQKEDLKLLSSSEENIEEQLKKCIKLELENIQNEFSLNYPKNVFQNPNIILDANKNKYTTILPNELKQSIEDTLILYNIILKQKNEITDLKKYFNQYKNEKWHFIIERKINNSKNEKWKVISVEDDLSEYIDKNVEEGRSYQYRLKAVNSSGSSKWSPIFRKNIGKTKVSPPSRLRVSRERNFRHILKWNDNSYNEDGFSIQRKESKDSKWKTIGSVNADQTIYIDENINTGTTYDYRVFAIHNIANLKNIPTNTVRFTSYLNHPYSISTIANLKSILVDWEYNFRYPKNIGKGKVTKNKEIKPFAHQETSFSDDLKNEISNREELLKISEGEFIIAKKLFSIYTALIDYEEKMRFQLTVFKNILFLFAILFIAIFIGIISSVLISYVTTLFYNAYNIRDKESFYFMHLMRETKEKNKNQPLLGFTLFPLILLLFGFGSSNISTNILDKDIMIDIRIPELENEEKYLEENNNNVDGTLNYKFNYENPNINPYYILHSLHADSVNAKNTVNNLSNQGYAYSTVKVQWDFLKNISDAKNNKYIVYIGPYTIKSEAQQWANTFNFETIIWDVNKKDEKYYADRYNYLSNLNPSKYPLDKGVELYKQKKYTELKNLVKSIEEEIDEEIIRNNQKISEEKMKEVFYKVQIGLYSKSVKDNLAQTLNNRWELEEIITNGIYSYFIGNSTNIDYMRTLKEEVIESGISDAFIVGYTKNGVRVL